jgi:anti-sigma B factor antagonist
MSVSSSYTDGPEEEGPMTDSSTEPVTIISHDERTATVQASGEIDTATSPLLRSCLSECLYRGCTEITVDMSELEFIDSSGIQVLVWAMKELRAADGRLVIRNAPSMAEKVLAISGITPYLTLTDSRPEEAVHPDGTL